MSTSLILLHIAAAVCLLLWGNRIVRQGFTRAYGTSLSKAITNAAGNRVTAFLSGLVVTALLQSSTATTLLTTSFAKKHIIPLSASLAVIIGADVATTLVAQVLSFDLSFISPALLIVGIIGFMMNERGGRERHLANILIGLGLMLLSLSLIRDISEPLQSSPTLPLILDPLHNDPILAVILAALVTWLLHSSLASVLLFASLAASGIIGVKLGILLVLGANIGGAIIPFAVTYSGGAETRRITFGNIIMRVVMLFVALPFLPLVIEELGNWGDASRQIVHFHSAFNVALAILFLPITPVIAKLSTKIFPEGKKKKDKAEPVYIDEKALESPVIALAGAARETLRMAEMVEEMLEKSITPFETGDEALIKSIRRTDNTVDKLYGTIKHFMTKLSQEGLDPKEADRYIQILTFSTNLEHIGDIIDKSLMELAVKKSQKQKKFSEEGFEEIKSFHNLVLQNMRLAQAIFLSEDPKLAAHLVEGKESIRLAADTTSKHHFKRLSEGLPATIETSSLHLDIIRDYRRINSYITRVAYAILENQEKYEDQRNQH